MRGNGLYNTGGTSVKREQEWVGGGGFPHIGLREIRKKERKKNLRSEKGKAK